MNEVTKLYENAGIKPYIYCSKPQLDCDARETGNCKQDCEYYSGERLLTPFTAEKQIELIKWLGELQIDTREGYWHLAKFGRTTKTVYADNCNLEEALSEIVNHLWQDLTAEKRKQIKEILE